MKNLAGSFIALSFFFIGQGGLALETDQFTRPQNQLVDLGPLLTEKIFNSLIEVIQHNSRTALDDYYSENFPARRLYERLGKGLPKTDLEKWIERGGEVPPEAVFKIRQSESVFRGVNRPLPGVLRWLAPTVQVYGVSMGTDKIGHFIQQGFDYYKIYFEQLKGGQSHKGALATAIKNGKSWEKGYFGSLISGVFSNGDLAANYAGFKFYINLTRPVTVGSEILPPILIMKNGRWTLSSGIDRIQMMRLYFTEHLNEAMNPSHYGYSRTKIRSEIKHRCPLWYPQKSPSDLAFETWRLGLLSTWYGEDYGYVNDPVKILSLKSECF